MKSTTMTEAQDDGVIIFRSDEKEASNFFRRNKKIRLMSTVDVPKALQGHTLNVHGVPSSSTSTKHYKFMKSSKDTHPLRALLVYMSINPSPENFDLSTLALGFIICLQHRDASAHSTSLAFHFLQGHRDAHTHVSQMTPCRQKCGCLSQQSIASGMAFP
ncbi:hypothetical protein V6N11_019059 [Hibiscus sabdariffa]|uniref:Uncharacterized protein n=1 Tax=Hibiscus sabdariffa TaxID=183260 RepID=A0ABR2R1N0_9ROSI